MTSLAKAAKSRVVLLVGEEEVARRRALNEILQLAEMQKDDFDLEQVDADVSGPQEWFASVSTSPFLAPRRTTIVRHLLRCEIDRLKGVDLAKLPESALLLLVADEETGSEEKLQRMRTTVRKGWEKAVEAAGGTVLRFEPNPKEAREGLRAEVAKTGKTMSDRAADALVEMTGGSLSRALGELDKLVLYVGEAGQVRESDVQAVVVPSREWNVFRMVDAIVAGEVPEALRQLRILVGASAKAEDAAFRQVLPQVSRALRLAWQGRLCVEAGCTPANAPASVTALFPDKPNLSKEPPYRQNGVMATARRTDLNRLGRCLRILRDTDARLKGALDSFSPIDTLERMVLELAQVASGSR